jgi:hypothetical protein
VVGCQSKALGPRDCRGLGLRDERTCNGMWRDRKRKENSGLCGVGGYIRRREHWLFYG